LELPRRPSTWSFSTRGLTADGYARALRGLLERGTLPMEPLPGYAPQVDILRWAIEDIGVLVANLAGVRHFATSNVKEFRDDIFVSVNLAGHCVVTQGRKELPMQSGEAVLFSSAEADFAAVRATPMEFLGLRLPYRALAPLARNLDDTLMRVVPADNPSLRLLVDYLRLCEPGHTTDLPNLAHAVAAHVRDLIALTISADRDLAAEVKNSVGAARLKAIKADVSRRLSGGDLTVAAVAARHAVTSRYVHRLFEIEGTTFSQFVLGRRLEFAHRLLTDSRFASRSIASIAFDAGFSDLSYFNRTFRRRYGATPTDTKASARSRKSEPPGLN
jgi:AraC-like DNA-binding protein